MKGPAALSLIGVLLTVPLPAAAGGGGDGPAPAPADREELRAIVVRHDVATAPERPGLAGYLRDLGHAGLDWLARGLDRLAPGFLARLAGVALLAAQVFFVAALALLAALGIRALYDFVRRRRALASRAPPVVPAAGLPAPSAGRSRDEWAAELRRRLAAADVAAACEALWWWLARTLVPGTVEPSWTSRELLARAGRRDLGPRVLRLDRMIYGAVPPSVDDVRRLWSDFEEAAG